jgi:acyl transferase domain-containing protein/thioesterase domain-containing protein/SAM-dependent methyltransferase/acyl carrier protein
MASPDPADEEAVAIIGMAGRFPGAADVGAFWQNLLAGVESISSAGDGELLGAGVTPAALADPRYVRARGRLDGVALFDAAFFGMSPREAELTDPQHRLFLELAWEALERAGHDPARHRGAIGVYAGAGPDGYLVHHLLAEGATLGEAGAVAGLVGNDKDYLATRVAYKLDLRGPAITVQTACSTSLVAVQLAWQALLGYQCDLALAGGVSVGFPLGAGHLHQEGDILSPDGHCRAFDARAQGTVAGDGVGVVVMKRLSEALADGDHVHAVILGAAVNSDGARKVGFTAPSIAGQAAVITTALAVAGVEAGSIGYVEAHGTGTPLGDPIEIAALTEAFRAGTARRGFCAVGSLKTNVGHLNAAAGVAGLIKAALAVERGEIPPSLHFTSPNPALALESSPFHVNTARLPFPSPRRAGVSSFGFGGTNAHVVLGEAPERGAPSPSRPWQLLALSARTEGALEAASTRLADHLAAEGAASLADVAFTLTVGRRAFEHRRVVVGRGADDVRAALAAPGSARLASGAARGDRPVAFVFPGQGAQHAGMAAELHRHETTFREHFDRCAALLAPHLDRDLRDLVFARDGDALGRTLFAQPALFAVSYALAQLWISWGVRPAALLGHSVGELVAACLAGIFSLEDALGLVAARGRLMDALPPGAMLAVPLPEAEVRPHLTAQVSLAAVNAPAACVVSGPVAEVEALERRLAAQGVPARRLHTSHAFHSAMMDPVLAPFAERVARVARGAPTTPVLSNVTGTWATAAELTDPAYWARHARAPVQFSAGLRALLDERDAVLLEVGPGRTLSTLALQHRGRGGAEPSVAWSLPAPRGSEGDQEVLLGALGRLWTWGAPVDWPAFFAGERRRRTPLPTYPFERRRFWIDAPRAARAAAPPSLAEAEAALAASLAIRPLSSHEGLGAALDALCSAHVLALLRARGVVPTEGAVHERVALGGALGVVPAFTRLVDAMLAMLAEDGLVRLEGDHVRFLAGAATAPEPGLLRAAIAARHPGFVGLLELLDRCARHHEGALTGRIASIGVLYPDGSPAFVEACEARTMAYRSAPLYLALLCEAARRLAAASPARPLRVLEVGGGAGSLTWALVAALEGSDVAYTFTDLGRTFVEDARRTAAEKGLDGRMTFGVLDLSRDPLVQGYAPASFDLVVAYNVLHATPDVAAATRHLRALLAPGGTLAAVEVVETRRWDTLTWGLAEGWWHHQDGIRQGSPLLSLARWERVLGDGGLTDVEAYPRDDAGRARADHGLLLARQPRGEGARVAEAAAPVARRVAGPAALHPRPALGTPYVAPRTGLERQVAAICRDLLGVERVGVHDPLFELGADSLVTLRLTDRLRRELDRDIPQHAAFRGSTVERLAAALEGTPSDRPSSPLVPIQTRGTRPPLFFVHPAAGVVFPYFELARELGPDQPFYGLQALGLDGESEPDTTVEAMARHYVEALLEVQPRGPYCLGGFSFGCLVAFEMAQQLTRAGHAVALLALVDEPAPVLGYRPSAAVMGKLMASGMARSFWPHLHDYVYLRSASPSEPGARWRESGLVKTFLARSALSHFIPPESRLLALRQPAMLPMAQLFMIHLREALAYVPQAYPHRVTLFRATELGAHDRDRTMGWSLLAAGGVEVHELSGEHLDLLRQPRVRALAAKLTACLDAVQPRAAR